jgi:hypothetical protein
MPPSTPITRPADGAPLPMTIPDRERYGVDDSFQRCNVPDPFAALMFVTRVSLAICILWARG